LGAKPVKSPSTTARLVDLRRIDGIPSNTVDKKALSERDICTKFISPAIERAGWDMQTQLARRVGGVHDAFGEWLRMVSGQRRVQGDMVCKTRRQPSRDKATCITRVVASPR
jgi:hypothetical protein